jgi:hypothetical protein
LGDTQNREQTYRQTDNQTDGLKTFWKNNETQIGNIRNGTHLL